MPASLQELTERLEALRKELERYGIVVPEEDKETVPGALTIPTYDAIRQELELAGEAPLRLSVQNNDTQLTRQRTLNFTPPLTATESSANKRLDITCVPFFMRPWCSSAAFTTTGTAYTEVTSSPSTKNSSRFKFDGLGLSYALFGTLFGQGGVTASLELRNLTDSASYGEIATTDGDVESSSFTLPSGVKTYCLRLKTSAGTSELLAASLRLVQ